MRPVSYARATDVGSAIATVSADPESAFLAGGTTEVDLLRLNVVQPSRLVDINALPLGQIEDLPGGGLRIGALARMSDVAEAPGVVERFPVIAQALVLGASAQLRHMASMGGNLLQRVRCSYFRDTRSACNKREPGSGCAALEGINRGHAILGTSEHCIATHPSDVAVALVALDAVVHTDGPGGQRAIPIDDFFLLPGDTPQREHPLDQAIADSKSPLHGADPHAVVVRDGRMLLGDQPEIGETYGELLRRNFLEEVDALGSWSPTGADTGYALTTFGAQFAEVAVVADLGLVRVRRLVGVFAPGRVLNPKTARSQLMGGMLWGLGQALLEGTRMDGRLGRWANASLGDYLVPVNADAPDVEVELVEVRDDVVNPLGVKGVGEIGQVGAAAIANAVFHATGRRVRELPIAVEDFL